MVFHSLVARQGPDISSPDSILTNHVSKIYIHSLNKTVLCSRIKNIYVKYFKFHSDFWPCYKNVCKYKVKAADDNFRNITN